MQTLSQLANALSAEADQAYTVINCLMPFLQINPYLNDEIIELERTVAMMKPFVFAANVWASDALAHEQALNNVVSLLNNPEFLIYWAFNVWNSVIQSNGQPALEWIGDEFMQLLNTYEQKHMRDTGGQHSQLWHRRQNQTIAPIMGSPDTQGFTSQVQPQIAFQQPMNQQTMQFQPNQIPPMTPVPGAAGQSNNSLDQLKQRIELMKNGTPDLAQQMQRAHIQQRQAMGLTN